VSPQVSTLDLVAGGHLVLTADRELGARAGRAATAAGLPATVTLVAQPLMRQLGAELIVVRPDQVVSAVWPGPAADQQSETEFLDTTMAMLCGRQGAETTWTRSH
jgi:hypothetical protein